MAIGERSRSIVCLVSIQMILIFSASWPGAQSLTFPQQYTIMHWARRIEQEIDRVFQHITGAQQLKGSELLQEDVQLWQKTRFEGEEV
ncbi:Voltage-dependent calcium channel subunit alpha-2/delta-2 [Oryzias melastigma]|uniref:Voltage-dependent calcium channel subunit alpha-2/delta-2 n=1 Tax=Oryzias melastigma TaxID=30732 RepID=A0A834CEF7_ORYME|nr:Voltage-dependent calcium channel subunit alpha-2/delta-2 [Oryzias melastigma]